MAPNFTPGEHPDSTQGLREENHRLRALVNAFSQLISSINLDEVLKNTLQAATEIMKARVGSIALINEERTHLTFVESTDKDFDKLKDMTVPLGEGIAGSVALTGQPERIADVHQDERFYGKIDEKLGHRTDSYLCVPLQADDKIIGTQQIMNRIDGRAFTAADEELLSGFAKQAALAIKNAHMHQVMLRQKALDAEFEVCAEIQSKLFPERLPAIPGFEIYGSSVPCRQVGGDYYTFIARPDGSYDALLGDVSGKGLSAALMVSELHTGFHLLSPMNQPLMQTVRTLDEHLTESLILGKFITLFAIRLVPGAAEFEYVVAGHPSPVIVNSSGEVRLLERTGPVLGLPMTQAIDSGVCSMDPGDVLICFSDGYSEALDPNGDQFDEERIADHLKKYRDLELSEIKIRLDEEIDRFTENAPAEDDATLLIIRRL